MERPNHDLQKLGSSKQSRAISLAITIAVQVGAVLALMAGLAQSEIKKALLDINASVVKQKVIPKAPPPPPPQLVRPPPVSAVVPQFAIEAPRAAPPPPPPPAAPAAPAPPRVIAPTKLTAIERTHTLPAYPTISQRLGEQGTSLMEVSIDATGSVTDCKISKSSGSQRLDDAACEFVKSKWKWQPPTQDGKPVATTTLVSVKWDLKNAQ